MKFKVLGSSVLIECEPVPEVTKSGIIVATIYKEKSDEGIIRVVGKDVKEVKVGDKVIFSKFAGSEIVNPKGKDMVILKEQDILAIRS